jgi:hypothetical protein
MAKYNGIGEFSGKVGDLIFVKQKRTQFAKAKPTAPIEQTEASKKASSDFGRASTAAAKIRKAFGPLNDLYGDDTLINRLNRHVIAVFNTIPQKFAGKKELVQGDPTPLNGFQFSSVIKLDALVRKEPIMNMLSTGQFQIQIRSGKHTDVCKPIPTATSAAMQLHVYNMDLKGNNHEIIPINELSVPFDKEFGGAELKIPLNLTGNRLVLIGMGIHYFNKRGKIGSRRARAAAIIFAFQFKNGLAVYFTSPEIIKTTIKPAVKGLDWNLG